LVDQFFETPVNRLFETPVNRLFEISLFIIVRNLRMIES